MSLVKSFPSLFQKNKSGKAKLWNISVLEYAEGPVIQIEHGILGGKMQITQDVITEGKNIGRANETTPLQQALAEAESKWTHKQERDGYVQSMTDMDKDTRPGIDPMLAHRYDKHPDAMTFPCFIQPKLDGHRCIAIIKNGTCELWSRSRIRITGVPHIQDALSMHLSGTLNNDETLILDGELYNHDYKNKFEDLASFIRSGTPKDGHEVVQYHVYDIVKSDVPYVLRQKMLEELFQVVNCSLVSSPIVVVETIPVEQKDVVKLFKDFRSRGYEGAMLRDPKSLYIGDRSYGLLKVKEFDDSEFKITGVNEGRGKLKGHAIFECVTEDGVTFEAKLKGDTSRLKEIFDSPDQYIGKTLTVQYQGRTKNNIPRFPVGLRIREDV